jgi:hypothetical protein
VITHPAYQKSITTPLPELNKLNYTFPYYVVIFAMNERNSVCDFVLDFNTMTRVIIIIFMLMSKPIPALALIILSNFPYILHISALKINKINTVNTQSPLSCHIVIPSNS